ncbi:MAG: Asp23/Gls24 family envelope stress response protein, partial [Clostridia bacterium]|nr:Asp23/Gls24 family envelope stress response protein [Clostridia bacterium]
GMSKLLKINIQKFVDGINLFLDINVTYGYNIPRVTKILQTAITKEVVNATGINIFSINVRVKGIDIKNK